jgi:hypothetical protein
MRVILFIVAFVYVWCTGPVDSDPIAYACQIGDEGQVVCRQRCELPEDCEAGECGGGFCSAPLIVD